MDNPISCARCQHENPAGARFCNACGAPLEAVCPACAHPSPPGSRFCNACGYALGASPPPPPADRFATPGTYTPRHLAERILTSRDALEGERKQVTVLFADLKGSMELLADRDPEDARRLLDPVLDRMMEAVHRYEGTVNQVMGDGIMALFGAPLAHEDHAVRACYAALAMLDAVGRYGDEVQRKEGVPIQIRVGLNSGGVVVRAIGSDLRMDYSAVGQTTHLAARMEQMAKPGSVLLTADVLRLAEGYVHVKPLGPVPVRGLAEPVEVFELTGVPAARTRLQVAATRGLTRFVGRDRELEEIRAALARAGGGQGQVLALVGDAGVGKSRLVWELTHSHRAHDWMVLESSSVSYGRATAYLSVIDFLRSYFRVEGGDDVRRTRELVTGKLLTLDPALEPTLPVFLALLGAGGDDGAWRRLEAGERRRRAIDAVRRLVLRESQVQPVIAVFEDLHWIDPDTQAILDGLVETIPAARLLLLVNYRPEYVHGWGGKTYYTQLRLDPLPPDTADALLAELLGADAGLGRLKSLLIERTQGNPFFLEESVRTLVDAQALAGERGAYRLAAPLQAVQLPATVQAVLAARIDRLAIEDKRLLQTASVVGKDVPVALLRAVADLSEEALAGGLAALSAREFLYEARLFPDIEYTFRHALTLEVAYGSLLHERRRALHARLVDAIERLPPGPRREQADRLAHHAFRGEAWGKALAYLQGGDAAVAPPTIDAVMGPGPESPGVLWWAGHHDRALEAASRDLAVGASFGSFPIRVVASFRLGQTCHSLGNYPRAVEVLRRNVASLEGDLDRERFGMAGHPSVLSRAWLGWCLAELGDLDEAAAVADEGARIAEATEHPYSLVLGLAGQGGVHLERGDVRAALPVLERGLVVDRLAGLPLLFPVVAALLGRGYVLAGRLPEGQVLLEEAVERAAAMALVANHALRLVWLGEAELAAGRLDRAGELARRALDLARAHGERGHEAHALGLLAESAARRDPPDLEAAEGAYGEAIALARTLGMRPLEARGRTGLGRLRA